MLLRKATPCPKKSGARCSAQGDGEQPWQAGVLPCCVCGQQSSKAQVEEEDGGIKEGYRERRASGQVCLQNSPNPHFSGVQQSRGELGTSRKAAGRRRGFSKWRQMAPVPGDKGRTTTGA